MVFNHKSSIFDSYLKTATKQALKPPPAEITRVKFTQDRIAEIIASDLRGDIDPHPQREFFIETLFKSVEKMITMIAGKYTTSTMEEQQDLVQECEVHLWSKLHKYDRKKAAFTTWSWRVCTNSLNARWRKGKRRRDTIVCSDEETSEALRDRTTMDDRESLRAHIGKAVMALIERFPSKKRMIVELYGDPTIDGYAPPRRVILAECSREMDLPIQHVTNFYRLDVLPFMREKLKDVCVS